MNLVLADGETNGTGNGVRPVLVQQHLDDENTLHDRLFAQRLLGRLGDDALVGLAVDHDLPFTGPYRLATLTEGRSRLGAVQGGAVLGLLPDRQTPFLKQLDRLINVTAEVIDQILAHNAHQVVANHLDVVFDSVFANIGVDSGQTLGNGTGTFHGCLVAEDDF